MRLTHFVPYTPDCLGRDLVIAACGAACFIHDYASTPQCEACKPVARAHQARLFRERQERRRRGHA